MYARVTTVQLRPDKLDVARQMFREAMAPAIHVRDGSKGLLYLAHSESGKALVITLWDNQEDMDQVYDSPHIQDSLFALGAIVTAEPSIDTFDMTSVQL